MLLNIMLGSLITSKTRLRMLIKFFVSAANNGYLNGLANEFNESTNSIRKELNNLSSAGYLLKSKENNKIIYNANTSHPMFGVLQKIVRQHLGLEDIVETVIERIGDVDQIALTGNYARGIDVGPIQIIIKGKRINHEYLNKIIPKIRDKISRDVNFLIDTEIDDSSLILFTKNNYEQ